jgi:two-component system, NtrC family, sensor kinase
LDHASAVPVDPRVAELETKLAAQEQTIRVLMARVEGQIDKSGSSLVVMQENQALELVVDLKTAQLDLERKKLEAALSDLQHAQAELLHASKLTAIGQLAAGIAHEINTPMQFVGDNTHFMQRAFSALLPLIERLREWDQRDVDGTALEREWPELRQKLKRAKAGLLCSEVPRAIDGSLEGIKRVTNIVRAMKEFSHPSSGNATPANLNDAILSTIEVTRNVWKYVATLETDFDPTLPAVPCLRDEFNQVVLNLIVNAAHAIAEVTKDGAEGKGVISVRTRTVGEHAEVSVSDTGTGIPEAIRARVFEPFFTTKAVGKGTGQGLAMAYAVINERHSGKIWLESEVGKGTTFFVQLPLKRTEPDA